MNKKSYNQIDLEVIALNELNKIYQKEIRHSLRSIFNNSEEQLSRFECLYIDCECLSYIKCDQPYYENDEECLKKIRLADRKSPSKSVQSKAASG